MSANKTSEALTMSEKEKSANCDCEDCQCETCKCGEESKGCCCGR